ncbi:MAG: HAMP domain-containing protein [Deltaproteobacteria bacterium]|nr:HAMP domain-containing protein [Deltaproteobacteria bacterium]
MKLSLATKIFAGFAAVLMVFGAVTVFGVVQLNTVRDQLGVVNRGHLPLNRVVTELEMLQESTRRSIDSILRFDNIELQHKLLSNNERSFQRNVGARLDRAFAILDKVSKQAIEERDRIFMQDARLRLQRIRELSEAFQDDMSMLVQNLDDLGLPASELPDVPNLKRLMRGMSREIRLLKLRVKNAITTQILLIEQEESSAVVSSLWLIVLALVVSIAVTVASLWAIRPIRHLSEAARRISEGDFSASVESSSSDELGLLTDEFNRMARSLGQRDAETERHKDESAEVNRRLRQSTIDLELITLHNKHIIRSMHNAILVVDGLGEVTTINPAAAAIWDLDRQKHTGKRLDQLPIATTLREVLGPLNSLRTGSEPVLYEACAFSRPKQSEVLVDLYVSALTSADGTRQGLLLVGEDVTDKVRTKQALLQSERLATIGRMSAVVAHEIRNPLSSIGLNTELLEDELGDLPEISTEEARSILAAIAKEVERLTEVTDEYLRFARLPKPQKISEPLHDILNNLLHFMQGELDEAKIELVCKFDPQIGEVALDANQLRQAFMNLFKNSTESMMEHGGVLTISTQRQSGQVEVRIDDTGRGIDAQSMEHIFDPFFSTRDAGTGLGLSLTQQIINEHGGNIRCESRPEQGTCFVVQLPIGHAGRAPAIEEDDEKDEAEGESNP